MSRPKNTFTPRQSAFIREYLVDLDATAAARRAGYTGRHLHVTGHDLLQTPHVKQAIEEALARRAARVEVKADDVLRTLLRVLGSDVRKAFGPDGKLLPIQSLPEDVALAIASIELDENGGARKVKFWSKDRAMDLAMKHLGLFAPEKHQVSGEVRYRLVEDPYAVPGEQTEHAEVAGHG